MHKPFRWLPVILVGLAVIAASLACSFGSSGQDSGVTLVNRSDSTICFVQMSPATDQYWGDDWLDSAETIDPGDSRSFDVEPGVWDLRAMTCDQVTIDEERQVTVPDSGYQWIVE